MGLWTGIFWPDLGLAPPLPKRNLIPPKAFWYTLNILNLRYTSDVHCQPSLRKSTHAFWQCWQSILLPNVVHSSLEDAQPNLRTSSHLGIAQAKTEFFDVNRQSAWKFYLKVHSHLNFCDLLSVNYCVNFSVHTIAKNGYTIWMNFSIHPKNYQIASVNAAT